MSLEKHLELFFGFSSEAVTHVYARAPRPAPGAKLAGKIVGPYCRGTRTLPMTITFTDLGAGPTLLARAVVPDLSPWLPDQPHLYKVQLETLTDQGVVDSVEREWSVHRFGARRADFLWNAQRWVLRGVRRRQAAQPLELWQESEAALIVEEPDAHLCEEASRLGVPLVAILKDEPVADMERLQQLARWPAVLITVLHGQMPDESPRTTAPNMVLAAIADEVNEPPAWAQAVFCDEFALRTRVANHTALQHLPVIATRTLDPSFSVAQSRGECDHLQRDLASFGQFAGYVVW